MANNKPYITKKRQMIQNLEQYPIVREDIGWTPEKLIRFENRIVEHWEAGKIRGPIHLSNGNEEQLIEIFKRVSENDWVFSTWRSHYHWLLKGISADYAEVLILDGKSITLCDIDDKFYASAIVGGTLSVALGVAMGIKQKGSDEKVFVFVGDMSFESGIFYEVHKYARNFDLPIVFVVEDNAVSTYTPTEATWNKKKEIPSDVIHYTYKSKYPHYGSGKWVVF
jgi:pyruvate dehydrogenase E1 component alpha subunit